MSAARRSTLACSRRMLHQTTARAAITHFQMPAMSPTMTEGGISSWKKKEGEAFSTGDVLLEIETDKATIDVEAQDDGVLGKILLPDGSKNVTVGRVIALLAEEGDDISNLEAPKEEPSAQKASSPTPPTPEPSKPLESQPTQPIVHGPPPSHTRPLFPSVQRLVLEHGITNLDAIKGTGVRGMLTKGDILTHLGKASGPNGTYKPPISPIEEANKTRTPIEKKEEYKPLDGPAIRRAIVNSWLQSSLKAKNPPPAYKDADFDSIIGDYLPQKPTSSPSKVNTTSSKPTKSTSHFLEGLI
ncbi:single hybrid motif-containing protein [Macrolepiota fuliginosa MF-IS2]|uniref:Single hybrid motif-containing protein n=1 Tax=Macrolepiota fuliginosa MF-IS2 TaxID=1400762 RepID=A0A9P6C501_9AGAR|nr:single hybrid motif-containing protein [Macrolepiota fuliginosa MF-IS2]